LDKLRETLRIDDDYEQGENEYLNL